MQKVNVIFAAAKCMTYADLKKVFDDFRYGTLIKKQHLFSYYGKRVAYLLRLICHHLYLPAMIVLKKL